MTAKQFLKQYEYANRRALRLKTEYERETELIDSVRSTLGGDGMPHGSGVSKTVEDRAIRLADKAAKWKMAEIDALHIRQEVFDIVNRISGIEGELLYNRYILCMTWEKVAEACDKSEKWCRTGLHSRALQLLQEILDTSL